MLVCTVEFAMDKKTVGMTMTKESEARFQNLKVWMDSTRARVDKYKGENQPKDYTMKTLNKGR